MKSLRGRIKLFLIVFLGSSLLTLFSYFGTETYGKVFLSDRMFLGETFIGPIEVSDLEENEAVEKIYEKTDQWKQTPTIALTYSDKKYVFTGDLYQFLVEESVQNAANEQNNPLHVLVKETDLNQELAFIKEETGLKEIDIKKLKEDLETYAATLPEIEKNLKLIDYFTGNEKKRTKTFSKVNVSISDVDLVKKWMEKYKEITIPAKESLSLLETIKKNATTYSDEFLSKVASGIYEGALYTNLEIIERNKSKVLPSGIKEGFEAKIVKGKMDLVLFNPNDTDLKIKFTNKGNTVTISIVGINYGYSYEPELDKGEKLKARTVVQYVNEPKANEVGKDGIMLTMNQNIYNANGGLIDYRFIAEDVYLPVHHIQYEIKRGGEDGEGEEGEQIVEEEKEQTSEETDELEKIEEEINTLHQLMDQLEELERRKEQPAENNSEQETE